MNKNKFAIAALIVGTIGVGAVFADGRAKEPVEFFSGHSHDVDGTHGAPSHSGGTDSNGCHNRSVPYHCH